jgi:hypothetical protein
MKFEHEAERFYLSFPARLSSQRAHPDCVLAAERGPQAPLSGRQSPASRRMTAALAAAEASFAGNGGNRATALRILRL